MNPSLSRQLVWLFFGFSGRVDRKAYVLASALSYIARMLPFYQVIRYPSGSMESEFWSLIFLVAIVVSLLANIALSVKRLHDADKPGAIAVVTIFLDIFAVIGIALLKATPGPNRHGDRPNAPRSTDR